MKALLLKNYMHLEYTDVPDPVPADNEVLIEVKAAGICGSDVHGMDGSTGRRIPPVIMGHEAAGIIISTGNAVTEWKPGDRVTFDSTIYRLDDWYTEKEMYNLSDNRMVLGVSTPEYKRDGAFAQYITVAQHILHRIPGNLSFVQAAMTEPAAVALHAVNLTATEVNDTAVVFGAGMIGLFLIQLLKLAGCSQVVAVDIENDKLKLADISGATATLNSLTCDVVTEIQKITDGRGADVAVEAVGISQTIETGIHSLRKGGTLTLVGNTSPSVEIPLQSIVTRQIRLQGSCAINGEYPAVLDLLLTEKLKTGHILSAVAPLSEGATWFNRLYNKEKGLIKVVLIP